MKYCFKRFWAKRRDQIMMGFGVSAIFLLMMVPFIANKLSEKNNPVDLTSEKGIKAKLFEYKEHQYIFFEKSNFFGSSSVVHDPDCSKCKSK